MRGKERRLVYIQEEKEQFLKCGRKYDANDEFEVTRLILVAKFLRRKFLSFLSDDWKLFRCEELQE